MHGSLERSGETVKAIYRNWGVGMFALPVFIVALLVGLAIIRPEISKWISEAAQAEFVGPDQSPEAVPAQIARPSMQIRTVRAN